MTTCAFPGCGRPRDTDSNGHADGDYCRRHEGNVWRVVPVAAIESGPYRACGSTGGDYIVSGPNLSGWLVSRSERAEDLIALLNLAYAAGGLAGRERALEIIEREFGRPAPAEPGSILAAVQGGTE